MKRYVYVCLMAMLITSLALGSEVRKGTMEDMEWLATPTYGSTTVTSAGEHVGHPFAPAPYVDIRAYGAVGDNATNNAAFIQAALDAVGSRTTSYIQGAGEYKGTVLIPDGTFAFGTTLTVPSGVALIGHGLGSVLAFTGSGAAIQTTKNSYNYLFRDFRLVAATGNDNATTGIFIQNAYHVVVDHCYIYGSNRGTSFSTAGIRINGDGTGYVNSAVIAIKDSYIQLNGGDGILLDGSGGGAVINITGNRVQANGNGDNTSPAYLTGAALRHIYTTGYGFASLYVAGNDFEGNVGGGINVDSLSFSEFTSNYIEHTWAQNSPVKMCLTSCAAVSMRNSNISGTGDNNIWIAGPSSGVEIAGNGLYGTTYGIRFFAGATTFDIRRNSVTAPTILYDTSGNKPRASFLQSVTDYTWGFTGGERYSAITFKKTGAMRGHHTVKPGDSGSIYQAVTDGDYSDFAVGDFVYNVAPVDNGYMGWICTVAGRVHYGTTTGTVTSGSDNVTGVGGAIWDWTIGDDILTNTDALGIAAGTTVLAVGGNWIQLSDNATDNGSVTLYGARFRGFGQIEAP